MFRHPHEPLAMVTVILEGRPLSVATGEIVAVGRSLLPLAAFRAGRFSEGAVTAHPGVAS